jgi:hypothetical protein
LIQYRGIEELTKKFEKELAIKNDGTFNYARSGDDEDSDDGTEATVSTNEEDQDGDAADDDDDEGDYSLVD